MNATKLLAAATLSILAAAGAQAAENFENPDLAMSRVAPALTAPANRAVVHLQAIAATGDESPDAAASRVAPALSAATPRSTIREQAVAAAHDRTQGLNPGAFFNSVVPSRMKVERPALTQQAGL
jgi:hypothetical protein